MLILKSKKILFGLFLVPVALLLSACSSLTQGTITNLEHKPAYDYTQYECTQHGYQEEEVYNYDTDEYEYKEVYECTAHGNVTHHVPDAYYITIQGVPEGEKDSTTATYSVSATVFGQAKMGYFYDSKTESISSR